MHVGVIQIVILDLWEPRTRRSPAAGLSSAYDRVQVIVLDNRSIHVSSTTKMARQALWSAPCIAVAGANHNDRHLMQATVDSSPAGTSVPPADVEEGVWLDRGDDDDAVYTIVRQHGLVPHIVPRDTERE